MRFEVSRNPKVLRLRKVIVKLFANDGRLLDQTYMFAWLPFFAERLLGRQARMFRRGRVMKEASREWNQDSEV